MGIFLRDPAPYLLVFRDKPRKNPNGKVEKRDRGMNLVPAVSQFSAYKRSVTGGANLKEY